MFFDETKGAGFVKYIQYLLIVFFIIFPFFNLNTFLYGGTSLRSVELITLASIIGISLVLWIFRNNNVSIPRSPILLSLVVLLVFISISALFGLNAHTSFWSVATRTTGIWYLLNLGIFTLALIGVLSNEARARKIILAVIVSTALYSVLAFMGPEGMNWIFKSYPNDGFTLGNSTFAGMYIFGAFLLSIYYIAQAEAKKWWMFLFPVLLLINPYVISFHVWSGNISQGIIGEARSSTYAIILSVIALIFIWLVSKIKDKKKKTYTAIAIFVLSLITIGVLAYSLFSSGGYIRNIYLSEATAARPLVWEMSKGIIAQRPYFGWGLDNFEVALENNYDNRLLQDDYGNEAWFDRAHNIFIDQIVDNGILGFIVYVLTYLTIILSLIYVSIYSLAKKDRTLASVLITYFAFHFLELQTAFDNSISYIMAILAVSLAMVILNRALVDNKKSGQSLKLNDATKYIGAAVLIVFIAWSVIWGVLPFIRTQIANGAIRTIGDCEARLPRYDALFSSPLDQHAFLWRTVTDFERGVFKDSSIIQDSSKVPCLKKELVIYESAYKEYIKNNPTRFRAYLNLADVLIFQRLLEVNKLDEAQKVLDQAIKLVPQSPQPYWMKAVGYVYMKKFDLAREYAKKAFDINPKIKQSQEVVDYVEKSIKNFPNIDLYFFKQI